MQRPPMKRRTLRGSMPRTIAADTGTSAAPAGANTSLAGCCQTFEGQAPRPPRQPHVERTVLLGASPMLPYTLLLKRCLDLSLACFGLACTLPFLPLIALWIKLDSRGPVLYRCARVGKAGQVFSMYKLRTMYETQGPMGASVSPAGDPRVTPCGRVLRRTKINELPQLLNILKGEMTFVGPRPEAPDLAACYPAHARAIFTVTPGLVGPSQILGRNEEEWYPPGVDPQQYYLEEILPKKLPLDLAYIRQPSLAKDWQYLVLGFKATVWNAMRDQAGPAPD